MKKLFLAAAVLGFTGTGMAQEVIVEGKPLNKESQVITIQTTGKDKKMVVEVNGDKVTVNGKPLSEFKDDEVTISKRNIRVRDRNNGLTIAGDEAMSNFWSDGKSEPRAFLGVTTDDAEGGAKITDISKGSAAEKAGLKKDDVITKVGDKKVDGPESLLEAVTSMKPKDEVTVYYKRDGKEAQAKTTLGERNESGSMTYSFSGSDGIARAYTIPRVPRVNVVPGVPAWTERQGMELSTSPSPYGSGSFTENYFDNYDRFFSRQQRLGLKIQDTEEGNGVKVLDVEKDSPAEKAGLKKDDIVTEVGGKKVSNTDEAREQLQENREKATYTIKANRNGSNMSFEIKIPKKLKTANL